MFGAVVGITLGAGAGVLGGTTLGDKVGVLRVEERDPSLELV